MIVNKTPGHTFRIMPGQAHAAVAKQALMIGDGELDLFTYREPYVINDAAQLASLVETLRTELGQAVAMPDTPAGVFYLIIRNGEAALIPQDDAPAVVWGIAFAVGGMQMAQRVSWRPEMVTIRER